MEALRWLDHLKIGGTMVINDHQIQPVPVNLGNAEYPEGIIEHLSGICDVHAFKAAEIATELGNPKAMNIVLLGALVKNMGGLDDIDWDAEIEANVKPKFVELNKKAFHAGYNL
jgi:indolepyruvate ferredoxin oxidoreductase beta subunit